MASKKIENVTIGFDPWLEIFPKEYEQVINFKLENQDVADKKIKSDVSDELLRLSYRVVPKFKCESGQSITAKEKFDISLLSGF